MSFHRNPKILYCGLMISVVVLTQACQWENTTSNAASLSPPLVSVTTVNAENVPIYSEYAAQTFARDMVEVRGRVDGYVEKRLFQVGSDVKAGQPLYILDLRPYQAEVQKARGDLAQGAGESRVRQAAGGSDPG